MAILTGKQLCWSLYLVKLKAFRTATSLKRDSKTGVFFCEYCETFKNTYFEKHLQMAASDTHFMNTILFINILLCKNVLWERFWVFHKNSLIKKVWSSKKLKESKKRYHEISYLRMFIQNNLIHDSFILELWELHYGYKMHKIRISFKTIV